MSFLKNMTTATRIGLKRDFVCQSYGKADKHEVKDVSTFFLSLQFSGHKPQEVNKSNLFRDSRQLIKYHI